MGTRARHKKGVSPLVSQETAQPRAPALGGFRRLGPALSVRGWDPRWEGLGSPARCQAQHQIPPHGPWAVQPPKNSEGCPALPEGHI